MMRSGRRFPRALLGAALYAALVFSVVTVAAQTAPTERTFSASKAPVEKALKQMHASMSGHLPTVAGFVLVGDHPVSRYQRAFYQCTAKVSATPSGGSIVRVTANVTAWYADPDVSHSGYQLLTSNGRLEADFLDRLADQLSNPGNVASASSPNSRAGDAETSAKQALPDEPTISAPMPNAPDSGNIFISSSPDKSLSAPDAATSKSSPSASPEKSAASIEAETATLQEALRNQVRPRNLVAVRKSGTPVVASPSLAGKTLFLADAHDEFEMLDYNADWVHVRISGLSRGWLWRTGLEMPEGISDVPTTAAASAPTAADLFQVSREETAQFPGDWAPLRGKSVKIISVQKIKENEQDGGPSAKLQFAKSLLDSTYAELAKSPDLSGLVLIFDSADGGMIAATLPTIRRWKAGSLTDAALWHQCYFDPPETFTVSSATTGAR